MLEAFLSNITIGNGGGWRLLLRLKLPNYFTSMQMIENVQNRLKNNTLTINHWLLVLFTVVNLLDFFTTKHIVDQSGFEMEANPFLLYLMNLTETVWVIFWVKAMILGFLFYWYHRLTTCKNCKTITPKTFTNILILLTAALSIVVCGNFYAIFLTL